MIIILFPHYLEAHSYKSGHSELHLCEILCMGTYMLIGLGTGLRLQWLLWHRALWMTR